ncbi:phosphoserine phosphatase SerB [Glutamicibacter uratoxydans]|uniref:phosphoserine phosphatase SerB n=1 Tax=Glutamicibacter uratoxydans TaxID=43667 RepID=UPI003D6DE6DE
MSSTLVLVSRAELPRPNFEAFLSRMGVALTVPEGAVFPITESSGRLVTRIHLPADEQELRTQVEAFAAEEFAGDYISAADICLAVVPETITQAERLLLVMDVDSTLIQQEVIELLAAHAGREAEVAAVTEAAMRGELDFAQSLIQRVATLKDLDQQVLSEVQQRIEYSPGARELVQRFHAAGHLVAVVSGGFQQILDPLATDLELDYALANTLGIVDGVLDGTVHGQIVDRATKETMLRSWAELNGIPIGATIAAGDGANDLDLLNAAGLGVAYNAKPALRDRAQVKLDFKALDVIADLVLPA